MKIALNNTQRFVFASIFLYFYSYYPLSDLKIIHAVIVLVSAFIFFAIGQYVKHVKTLQGFKVKNVRIEVVTVVLLLLLWLINALPYL